MSEPVRWLDHEGVKILYADARGIPEATVLDLIDVVSAWRQNAVDAGDPYHVSLLNLEGMIATRDITRKARHSDLTKHTDKVKIAIVGVSRAKKIILGMVAPTAKYFNSEDDAKAWLVAEAQKKVAIS